MTDSSPPPPLPPTPGMEILPEYVSNTTVYNGLLVLAFLVAHTVIFIGAKEFYKCRSGWYADEAVNQPLKRVSQTWKKWQPS